MKRFFGMGLVVLTLAVIAAQCGAAVAKPANDTSNQAVEETSVEEVAPEEETALEEEAVAEVSAQSATCDDLFADAGNLKFSPRPWTAEQIARFVTPGLVDPASGLETNFCMHSVDYAEILSGGPPPDGIPPLITPLSIQSQPVMNGWLMSSRSFPWPLGMRHALIPWLF